MSFLGRADSPGTVDSLLEEPTCTHLTVRLCTWAMQEDTLVGDSEGFEVGLGGPLSYKVCLPGMSPISISETLHTCMEDQGPLRASQGQVLAEEPGHAGRTEIDADHGGPGHVSDGNKLHLAWFGEELCFQRCHWIKSKLFLSRIKMDLPGCK